jgi:hypothetical protein
MARPERIRLGDLLMQRAARSPPTSCSRLWAGSSARAASSAASSSTAAGSPRRRSRRRSRASCAWPTPSSIRARCDRRWRACCPRCRRGACARCRSKTWARRCAWPWPIPPTWRPMTNWRASSSARSSWWSRPKASCWPRSTELSPRRADCRPGPGAHRPSSPASKTSSATCSGCPPPLPRMPRWCGCCTRCSRRRCGCGPRTSTSSRRSARCASAFRIDGMLQVQTEADPKIAGAVALRLKLMSGLDISEKRLPQDGRFNVQACKRQHGGRAHLHHAHAAWRVGGDAAAGAEPAACWRSSA